MEPENKRSAEERLKQLRLIVAIGIVFGLGLVLGWIGHDHVVIHVKRGTATPAAATSSPQAISITPGGER